MAKLNAAKRNALPSSDFVFPGTRKYPIEDAAHARDAKSRAAHQGGSVQAKVDAAGSREFAAAAWATRQLTARHFDTLYHELFNEAEPARSQVMKQLGDWLARLPG